MATKRSDVDIQIQGDNAPLDKALQGAEASLKEFARDLKGKLGNVDALAGLQADIVKTGTALEQARDRVRTLANELAASGEPAQGLQNSYREAVAASQALERQLASQGKRAEALGESLKTAGVDTGQLNAEQKRLAQEIERTNKAIDAEVARTRARRRTADAREVLGLPDPRQVDREIARIQGALKRLQASGKLTAAENTAAVAAAQAKIAKLRGETENSVQRISRGLGSLRSAFLAIGGALAVRSIVDATIAAERAQTLLAAKLKSTGREAEFADGELEDMSETLQAFGNFDDDAISELQTALLGFRNVARDVFEDTAKAVIDFSSATGTDLQTAAETIGKVMDAPLRASKQLRSIGVNLGSAEQQLIKQFVAAGDAAAAQRVILEALQRVYGGAATAAKDTLGGALEDLKNSFQNLLEGGGGSVTGARDAIQGLTATLNDPAVAQGIGNLINGIIRLVGVLADAASRVGQLGDRIARFVADISGNLSEFDRLTGKINDLNRALESGPAGRAFGLTPLGRLLGFGVPLRDTFKSAEEIRKEIAKLEAERDRIAPGAAPLSTEAQEIRVGELRTQIDALTGAYDILFDRIRSGASVTDGTLERDAREADALKRQITALNAEMQRLQGRLAEPPGGDQPSGGPKRELILTEEERERLAAEARARAEAIAAAGTAIAEAQSARRQALLDDELAQNRISLEQYYADSLKLQTDAIDREIKARQDALATADENARTRLNGEIQALGEQRVAAVEASARAQRDAEQQLADQITELQAQLLETTEQTAEARALIVEQKFRDLRDRLVAEGNVAGVGIIDRLIATEKASGRLDELQAKIDKITAGFERVQSDAANRVQTGELSQDAAQGLVGDAAVEAAGRLRPLRIELQGLALEDVPGAQEALDGLDQSLDSINQSAQGGVDLALRNLRLELANLQSTFAGETIGTLRDGLAGLFTSLVDGSKSAKDALRDFARGFAQQMAAIAARALATMAVLSLLDAIFPGAGKLAAAGGVSAGVAHTGRVVGRGGPSRRVPGIAFAAAPRFHGGGVPGLKPGELPIIAQEGEEILSRSDPRNVLNGGRAPAAPQTTRIVNVIDPNLMQDYLTSSSGEKVLVNMIERNAGSIKQVLR